MISFLLLRLFHRPCVVLLYSLLLFSLPSFFFPCVRPACLCSYNFLLFTRILLLFPPNFLNWTRFFLCPENGTSHLSGTFSTLREIAVLKDLAIFLSYFGGGGWRPGCEASPSPPSNSEANNMWSCTASSPSSFMAWHSGSLTFTFVLPLMLLHLSLFAGLYDILLIQYGAYSFRAGPSGYVLRFLGNLCFAFRQHWRYGR